MPQKSRDSQKKNIRKVIYQLKMMKIFSLITFAFVVSSSVNAQVPVKAIFTASPLGGCNPLEVTFANSSTGQNLEYLWDFGVAPLSTAESPTKIFPNPGVYIVTLTVTNTVTLESDIATQSINIDEAPNLDFTFSAGPYCIDEPVEFTYKSTSETSSFSSLMWKFGDGTTSTDTTNPITHYYSSGGNYNVSLYSYNDLCGDTADHSLLVIGSKASFTMDATERCVGDSVRFTLGDTSAISSFTWYPEGEGGASVVGISPYSHPYNSWIASFKPYLIVNGPEGSCTLFDTVLTFYKAEADFNYASESEFCNQRSVFFINESPGSDFNNWDFGDGEFSTSKQPVHAFDAGEYTVTLNITNSIGCKDDTSKSITINSVPLITVGNDTTICPGDSVRLWASGGHTIDWNTSIGLSNRYSYSPMAADSTFHYSPQVTDTTTNCKSIPGSAILVISIFDSPEIIINVNPEEDTIYNGGTVTISIDTFPIQNYNFSWSPDQYISCTDCATPTISPLDEGYYEYFVVVSDKFNCRSVEDVVKLTVEELYTIGVSEAFTPNGDGNNDCIMVAGFGVRKLVEFSIYNRWGKRVFSTDNFSDTGWDGKVDGKEQGIDTYTYYIKAEMLNDTFLEKRGAISLYR